MTTISSFWNGVSDQYAFVVLSGKRRPTAVGLQPSTKKPAIIHRHEDDPKVPLEVVLPLFQVVGFMGDIMNP